MFIIGRAPGQELLIGDDVVMSVVDVRERAAMIAVAAPGKIAVNVEEEGVGRHREEQYQREAGTLTSDDAREEFVREVGEAILIGREIRVTLVAIRDGAARLGIESPPHIAISRAELGPEVHSRTQSIRREPRGSEA